MFGALMAVLVVFIFMRDWRSTLITALALPTSVISTFFFMWIAGFTINMMTLMALSLVIGILIDDAVVVRENIYRHMEHGEDPMRAAQHGTAEIGLAVMATTFTILAVFLPVGFMTGIVGQFFKSFALTIAFAVAMSLFVAFTLDPMLSSRFVVTFRPRSGCERGPDVCSNAWVVHTASLDRGYHRVLRVALNNPWKSLGVAAAVFVASLSSVTVAAPNSFRRRTGRVPGDSRAAARHLVRRSVANVARVEQAVRRIPEVTQVFSTVGTDGQVRSSALRVKVTKKDQRERGIGEIKDQVRALLAEMAFVDGRVGDPEFMQGAPYEPHQHLHTRDDLATLQRVASEVQAKQARFPGPWTSAATWRAGSPK